MVAKRVCHTCKEEKAVAKYFNNSDNSINCVTCSTKLKADRLAKRNAKRVEMRLTEKARTNQRKQARAVKKSQAKAKRAKVREDARKAVHEELRAKREVTKKAAQVNIAQRELAIRKLAQMHLLPFVLRMEPDYLPGWVHKDICQRLERFEQDIVAGKSPRLMLQLPPRAGKSTLASQYFPAWFLGRNPKMEVMSATYSGSLALGFSRKVRQVLREPRYHNVFKTRLDKDNQNAEGWATTASGMYVPAGVGGALTGKGAHCVSAYNAAPTPSGAELLLDIKVGDKVLGYDHTTNKPAWTTVKAVSVSRKPSLIRVGPVSCTPDHRIWTSGRGYVQARELEPTDDLVTVRPLLDGVPPEDEGTQKIGYGLWGAPKNVLLAKMLHPPEPRGNVCLRVEKGSALEPVSEVLHRFAARQLCATGVPQLWHSVSPSAGGIRQTDPAPRTWRRGLLLPRVLQHLPAEQPTTPEKNGELLILRGRPNWWAKAEQVLWALLLHSSQESAGTRKRVPELHRRLVEEESANGDTGRAVPDMRSNHILGSAPHRPQRGEPQAGEFNHFVPPVPHVVSPQRGICARSLQNRVQGDGELVVDLQTDTENFFCEGVLVHNCLLIDDPIKNSEESESSTVRESIKDWYASTAYTRLAPGGGVCVIQTRWHSDDLSGWLESQMHAGTGDKWEIVRYPAVALKDEKYRKKGEALHPERYDEKALARIEKAVGPRVWDALYQQQPVAEDGTYFTKDMIHYYTGSPPERLHNYCAWDLAIGKSDRNDFTVGVTAGVDINDNLWILDLRRGRWDAFEIAEQILDAHRQNKAFVTGIERGQLSLAIGPYLDQRIQEEQAYDLAVKDMPPGRRDKESRARAIQGRMRQGKVFFPKDAPWMATLYDEMMKFPLGQHDDQCVLEGTKVLTPYGEVPVETVRPGDMVMTHLGMREVLVARCTNEASPLVRVAGLTCSPNHPICVEDVGFIPAAQVQPHHKVVTMDALEYEELPLCRQKRLNLEALHIEGTPSQATPPTGGTFEPVAAGRHSTGLFGLLHMGLSRTAIMYTIKTGTARIMTSITSSVCHLRSTTPSTGMIAANGGGSLIKLPTLAEYDLSPQLGTSQTKDVNGIKKWPKTRGRADKSTPRNATRAGAHMKRTSPNDRGTAPTPAPTGNMSRATRNPNRFINEHRNRKPVYASTAGVSFSPPGEQKGPSAQNNVETATTLVEKLPQPGRVYNLLVDEAHTYFTNGVLSHNCDALAYIGLLLQDMTPPTSLLAPSSDSKGWRKKLRTQITVAQGHGGKHMRA